MAEPEYLRRLSEFICGATLEDLPAEVVDRGRWIIADCLCAIAVGMQAATVLMPVSARRALQDLPDDCWTKTNIEFYGDPTDGVFKALME